MRGKGGGGAPPAGGASSAVVRFSRHTKKKQSKAGRLALLRRTAQPSAKAQSPVKASGTRKPRCPPKPQSPTKAKACVQAKARGPTGCPKCRFSPSGCKRCRQPGGLGSLQRRLKSGAGPPGTAQPKASSKSPSGPAQLPVRAST